MIGHDEIYSSAVPWSDMFVEWILYTDWTVGMLHTVWTEVRGQEGCCTRSGQKFVNKMLYTVWTVTEVHGLYTVWTEVRGPEGCCTV